MINLFQPQVGAEELDAVAGVFHDRRLGSGRRTTAFETAFAEHLGIEPGHVVFTSSGTTALHLAVETLDLEEGDEVVLPSLGLPATAEAVAARGGRPVFCDVDRRTLNPSLEDVEAALTDRTRAVLFLHYGGRAGDIVRIAAHCRERGLALIEDGACSVASRVDGRPAGTFGDLAVWSFDPGRVLVTGDGGMVYAKDPERAARTRLLARRGLVRASGFGHASLPGEPDLPEYGRGIAGNDLTAAIGTVQLRRLPEMVERRREIAARYDRELAGTDGLLTPPPLPEGHESTDCLYWVQLHPAIKDGVVADLLAEEIYTTSHHAPLHRFPADGDGEPPAAPLPSCDWAVDRTVRLPLHPGLSDADVTTVIDALRRSVRSRLSDRTDEGLTVKDTP
ncbi:aminotransferase [Streptomyces sp. 3211.6]|uniref:DegT/DnrJ/EryC1/StrS family aminotransferase n=1 Tax=Streptomyces TaxID=1883 RepID=UPI0009A53F92|nr:MULTISPECIES: DegT/DnrJ/EryC1/StrS family aminotransferase [Streptomyces]RKS97031.1 aminotransferase [Streptomyces sp. 3211.6]RPF25394.1 aminotransferase [Streptomyces sp. Ag109_G2-6]